MKTGLKTCVTRRAARMSYGLHQATSQWFDEWTLFRLHHREVEKARQLWRSLPVKLNLGCGPNHKDGWVNVDLFDAHADLQLDLRELWPFPDSSVSYIYSEHVFEHFEFHVEVPHFLGEAFRVLESTGTLDVVVPDTEPPLRAYGNPSATYWSSLAKRWHPEWCETELDHINFHFRQDGEHKCAWDAETLRRTLKAAGFTNVLQREFNPLMDTEERRIGSLYMTGIKP